MVANVFQELIQNAEDARASQVKFLHDKHSYRAGKLHSGELAKFQVRCVIYQTRKSVFDHTSKHREESLRYEAQKNIFDELRGFSKLWSLS